MRNISCIARKSYKRNIWNRSGYCLCPHRAQRLGCRGCNHFLQTKVRVLISAAWARHRDTDYTRDQHQIMFVHPQITRKGVYYYLLNLRQKIFIVPVCHSNAPRPIPGSRYNATWHRGEWFVSNVSPDIFTPASPLQMRKLALTRKAGDEKQEGYPNGSYMSQPRAQIQHLRRF